MSLSWNEIRTRAIQFSKDWSGEKREGAESQSFWNDFFNVFGVRRRTVAAFEEKVRNLKGRFGFIDLFWRGKLLVEHKSRGASLEKAASQAFEYIQCLKDENRDDEIPRYVIVSDFSSIVLYDLEPDEDDPPVLEFPLSELHKHIHAFAFIPGYKVHRFEKEDPANIRAAELMGGIHDALAANGYTGAPLERFLVRVLFCLFAEDTGIFEPDAFTAYIEQQTREDGDDLGSRLTQLFETLDTPEEERQKNLDELLAAFRYIDGGLFEDTLRAPACNRDIRNALLAATRFDWSRISPAVFGSMFQFVMDPGSRRQCGAHYTTEQNILKVIRPLFLDDLRDEFVKIKKNRAKLREFHKKLSSLTFFDPACGCGNFLVLAYRELRLLEMDVLAAIHTGVTKFFDETFVSKSQIDVDQMYGIEIVEFPVRIAETALWLMDHQMNVLASERFGQYYLRLPLKKSAKIVHANALRIDWNDALPKNQCSYILSNPPFVGAKYQTAEQKTDSRLVFGKTSNAGLLDYVACWYIKAAEYISGTQIRVGFVSTNSIAQGEQAGVLWTEMFKRSARINFGYSTFVWTSEARGKAHVHCVIIGFSLFDTEKKLLFEEENGKIVVNEAGNINPWLIDAPDVLIINRSKPLCQSPEIGIGNKPIDGGNYLFTEEEKAEFLKLEPAAAVYFRKWLGADEFINGWNRWCLWLGDCPPEELRKLPECMKRVEAVRRLRLESKSAPTRNLANTPARFHVENMPSKQFLVIPSTSSEHRNYIPMGFITSKTIVSNACLIIQNATLFDFGVLTSAMHMDWTRRVCGRLESRYRYSAKLVYNNFPWPEAVSDANRKKVEEKAQAVLNVRASFPKSSLSDLYDPISMPAILVKAHRELDRAVDRCYRSAPFKTGKERLSFLFERHEKLTS